jgi:hypothetical protein
MTIGSKTGLSLLVSEANIYVVFLEPCDLLDRALEYSLYRGCDVDMPSRLSPF